MSVPATMTANDAPINRPVLTGYAANLGLAVLGLLITHETAYSVATWLRPFLGGDGSPVDHGHQSLLAATAGPLALWTTAVFVLRQVRQLDVSATWGAVPLAAVTGALYLTQELIEIVAAGPEGPGLAGLVENRAIVLGILAVPLVSRVLLHLLQRAEALIVAWLTPAPDAHPSPAGSPVSRGLQPGLGSGIPHEPGDPRGPPLQDVTTVISLNS